MEFSRQARTLEQVTISFPGGSSQPRDRTWISCRAGRFFAISATRKAHGKAMEKPNHGFRLFQRTLCSLWSIPSHCPSVHLLHKHSWKISFVPVTVPGTGDAILLRNSQEQTTWSIPEPHGSGLQPEWQLSAEGWGIQKRPWESLRLQGDPTSQS